jgi:mannose-6-phosphate isomerase
MRRFAAYPLLLSFGIRRYAFGARLIPDRLGKPGLPGGVIAETWEVSDHDDEPAVVLNGAYRGRRLRELVAAFPGEVERPGWSGPHLPLLVKFLDASHRLPVHVHPDDAAARAVYRAANGKDEAWHVVWAAPGASVLAGVRPGVDLAALRSAFRAGAYDDVLLRHPVAAGDTVLVPGGVLHGFGPDTLIVEVQQTSDLAESVMPDDVYGRPLAPDAWAAGLERALAIATSDARPRPQPGVEVATGALRRTVGCRGERFVLERWTLSSAVTVAPGEGGFVTLTNLGDAVDVEHERGVVTLPRAASCLLPAALVEVRLHPSGQGDLVACFEPGDGTWRG